MILDVYIGSLKDRKFSWDGRDWNGNVPRQRSPDFPDGDKAFWEVRRRITKGDLDGKQTDWGGWVARCNKSQIEAIIVTCMKGILGTNRVLQCRTWNKDSKISRRM